MLITAFELIVAELISKSKVTPINPAINGGAWECVPHVSCGFNYSNQLIANIEMEIIRKKKDKMVSIKTMTSFRIIVANKNDINISTQRDFEIFTLFNQIALSHSRVIFLYEMKGTYFQNDLLHVESNEGQMRKLKLALGISPN